MKRSFVTDTQRAGILFPSLYDMSASAYLLTVERVELKHLESLKCYPTRATQMLKDSIKDRANWLIQAGVTV